MKTAYLQWLLDTAVEYAPPLHFFLPRLRGEHLNVRDIPGFQIADYAKLIELAIENGLLELLQGAKDLDVSERIHLDLSEARNVVNMYARGLRAEGNVRFNLLMTPLGGEKWERIAHPQWDRFFYFSCSLPDDERRVSATLASRNRDAVMAYLGWFESLESVDVNWDTVRIETRSNYAATYWKRLDGIYEATLDGIYHLPERCAPTFASDWRLSLSKWSIRPWERPDWPSELTA